MIDRAAAVIATGDALAILRMAMSARFAAEEGRFCECATPILHGRDLMCGGCLLENWGQIAAREKAMREPHPFEPGRSDASRRLGMCGLCAWWRDDPRHLADDEGAE